MAQHARTAILAEFEAALGNLSMSPTVFTDLVDAVAFSELPALSIAPGPEGVEGADHAPGFPTIRRFRVHVVCSATSQALADEMAGEVETAAPYASAGMGATYAGSEFAASAEGEKRVFQTQVNFDVLYEVTPVS